jgi:hypothetical protein
MKEHVVGFTRPVPTFRPNDLNSRYLSSGRQGTGVVDPPRPPPAEASTAAANSIFCIGSIPSSQPALPPPQGRVEEIEITTIFVQLTVSSVTMGAMEARKLVSVHLLRDINSRPFRPSPRCSEQTVGPRHARGKTQPQAAVPVKGCQRDAQSPIVITSNSWNLFNLDGSGQV